MASEALIGATAAAAVIVAQRVRSWDVAALVASLTDDADDAERFADACVRLPRRLSTLLKGKSPLDETASEAFAWARRVRPVTTSSVHLDRRTGHFCRRFVIIAARTCGLSVASRSDVA